MKAIEATERDTILAVLASTPTGIDEGPPWLEPGVATEVGEFYYDQLVTDAVPDASVSIDECRLVHVCNDGTTLAWRQDDCCFAVLLNEQLATFQADTAGESSDKMFGELTQHLLRNEHEQARSLAIRLRSHLQSDGLNSSWKPDASRVIDLCIWLGEHLHNTGDHYNV